MWKEIVIALIIFSIVAMCSYWGIRGCSDQVLYPNKRLPSGEIVRINEGR